MGLRLSKEEQYGIIALIDLSRTSGGGSVERVKTIAERQNIPTRFLEQIFSKLRQADIVVGKRGPSGGYRLARNANEITLDSVMSALRPNIQATKDSSNILVNAVNSVWTEIETSFQDALGGVTLETLKDRTEQLTEEQVFEETVETETLTDSSVPAYE